MTYATAAKWWISPACSHFTALTAGVKGMAGVRYPLMRKKLFGGAVALNVNRVSELEVEEDGWDGMYYFDGKPFTGLSYSKIDGILFGETWYREGLHSGWQWNDGPNNTARWIGHCWKNGSHGESWQYHVEGWILRWSVSEYSLPVRSRRYAADGTYVSNSMFTESCRLAVNACRARAGIEGETDPLVYPLRGPDFDTSLIIREFFEPYR